MAGRSKIRTKTLYHPLLDKGHYHPRKDKRRDAKRELRRELNEVNRDDNLSN